MPPALHLTLQALALLAVFTGAGLYLRGFWVYFRAMRWLRQPEQAPLRQHYRSSTLAAILRAESLQPARRQLVWAVAGLGLFILGGTLFNALQAPP